MDFTFKPAVREQVYLKMALHGTSGSGKTWTALAIARAMFPNGKIAVIDTEGNSASKYAGHFSFDVLDLRHHHPDNFIRAIQVAVNADYDMVIIDSASHEWSGAGGIMEIVDKAQSSGRNTNKFAAWGTATPLHNKFIRAIIDSKIHIIATIRAKTEYALNEHNKPIKVGMGYEQRSGFEYEFDIVGRMDADNSMTIDKTRCPELNGKVFNTPGADVAEVVKAWIRIGVEPSERPTIEEQAAPKPQRSSTNPFTEQSKNTSATQKIAASKLHVGDTIVATDGTTMLEVIKATLDETQVYIEIKKPNGETQSVNKAHDEIVTILKRQDDAA